MVPYVAEEDTKDRYRLYSFQMLALVKSLPRISLFASAFRVVGAGVPALPTRVVWDRVVLRDWGYRTQRPAHNGIVLRCLESKAYLSFPVNDWRF